MRKQLSAVAAVLLALIPLSCNRNENPDPNEDPNKNPNGENEEQGWRPGEPYEVKAEMKDAGATFSLEDAICVYYAPVSTGDKFTCIAETPQVVFKGSFASLQTDPETFLAVYPFGAAVSCKENGVEAILSAHQTAQEGSFAPGTLVAVAACKDLDVFPFYNVCSGLWFSLTQEGITSVTFAGNNNEDVAGTFQVSLEADGKPGQPVVSAGAKSITLSAPDGKTFEVGKKYYVAVLPQTFSKGVQFTFTTAAGTFSCQKEESQAFSRAQSAGFEKVDEAAFPAVITASNYLTFTSEGTTSLSMANAGDNAPVLYYSTDKEQWTEWDYAVLSFSSEAPLYLSGTNPAGISSSEVKYSSFSASGDAFSVSGSIMALIDKDKEAQEIPAYAFYALFKDCAGLVAAPELPAAMLAASCYQQMFSGCSKLSYVKCLATDISAANATEGWLKDVAPAGTFVRAFVTKDWPTGENGIPAGWEVEAYSAEPVFNISPTQVSLDGKAQSFVVSVESSVEYEVEIVNGGDWITEGTVSGSALEGYQHQFLVARNDGEQRTGLLTFCSNNGTCHPVVITQDSYSAVWVGKKFTHHSLGMRFTATWCGWCPRMNKSFAQAKEKLGDRFNYVTLHASSSSLPFMGTSALENQYHIGGYPTGIIDGRRELQNYPPEYAVPYIEEFIDETEANYPTATATEVRTKISGRTAKVDVDVFVKFAGTYMITVFLLEDGIVASQSDFEEGDHSYYVHNKVARLAMTSAKGDTFTVEADNSVHSFTYSVGVSTKYNLKKMSALVYVQRQYGSQKVIQDGNYGDYYVDNSREVELGKTAELEVE